MAGMFAGLWKGLFGTRQDELNEQVTEESLYQMKHPFARTIEDAQNYGINPMTALGSQPSQATFSGSQGESNPGQLLSMIPALVQASASRSNSKDSNKTQRDIAGGNNSTQSSIAKNNNDTAVKVAGINASSAEHVADKNADAMKDLRKAQEEQTKTQTMALSGAIKHREEYGYQPDAPSAVNLLSINDRAIDKSSASVAESYVPFLPSNTVLSSLSNYDSYIDWCKRMERNGHRGKYLTESEYWDYKERMARKSR